jgi:hypothetical protein
MAMEVLSFILGAGGVTRIILETAVDRFASLAKLHEIKR